MFTNRLFNLIVAALIVVLAVLLISVTGAPAAKPIDHSPASKYAERYDRMNDFPDADNLYNASKYADRYDYMNNFPGTDHLYKHEDRYDAMNDGFLSNDHSYTASKYEDRYDRMNDLSGTDR